MKTTWLAVIAALVTTAPAYAAVTVNWTQADTAVGVSKTVNFNGSVSGNAAASAALDGSLKLVLTAVQGNTWKFDYTLSNLSNPAQWSSVRLGVFGFNGAGSNGFSGVTLKTGIFDTEAAGNTPQAGPNLAFCAKTGGQTNNCNSGNDGVLLLGASVPNAASYAAGSTQGSLWVQGLSNTNLALTDFYVRYQSLDGFGENGGSGIGLGDSVDLISAPGVPEPATWAMMIGGFGLVGGVLRRRRALATA